MQAAEGPCMGLAGVQAWRRARFAAAVRLVTQLDEEGLQFVLKNLPAWVKVRRWSPATLHCTAMSV